MAPARMVAFMEKHISQCEECLADPDVRREADKIREIVLPPSKIPKPKVVRATKEEAEEDEEVYEDEEGTSEDEDEDEDTGSEDEDEVDEDYDPDLIDDDDEI